MKWQTFKKEVKWPFFHFSWQVCLCPKNLPLDISRYNIDRFHIYCFIDSSFCFIFLIILVLEPGIHQISNTSYLAVSLGFSLFLCFTGFWSFSLYFKLTKGLVSSFALRYPIFTINTKKLYSQKNFILNLHSYTKTSNY